MVQLYNPNNYLSQFLQFQICQFYCIDEFGLYDVPKSSKIVKCCKNIPNKKLRTFPLLDFALFEQVCICPRVQKTIPFQDF